MSARRLSCCRTQALAGLSATASPDVASHVVRSAVGIASCALSSLCFLLMGQHKRRSWQRSVAACVTDLAVLCLHVFHFHLRHAVLVLLQQQGAHMVPELMPTSSLPGAAQLIAHYHNAAVVAWHKAGHPGWSRWEDVGSARLAQAFEGRAQLPHMALPVGQMRFGQPKNGLANPLLSSAAAAEQAGAAQQAGSLLRRNSHNRRQQHDRRPQQLPTGEVPAQQANYLGGPENSAGLIGALGSGFGLLGAGAALPQQRQQHPQQLPGPAWPLKPQQDGAQELQASSIAAFLDGNGDAALDALLGEVTQPEAGGQLSLFTC